MTMRPLQMIDATPPAVPPEQRVHAMRRASQLAWLGIGWHVIEAAVAVGAGLAASSIALVGFGFDSVIEALAGFVVVWLFAGPRAGSPIAERRAQQVIALSFALLAVYVAVESVRTLMSGHHPETSWLGIALALVTAPTMPLLARAKKRVGLALGSSAAVSESAQTMLCAYLSITLLIGLGLNAFVGWWWADPLVGLVIAVVAVREARTSWRGESCGCCAPVNTDSSAR